MGQEEAKFELGQKIVDRITRNYFEFQYVVGRGGFGKVWKVTYKKTNKLYAIKEMSKAKIIDKKSIDSIQAERDILSALHSPFIVNLIYSFQDHDYLYLVMDFLTGGNLRYHLTLRRRFNEEQTKFFIACTLLGLEYIHQEQILHRDIKPENLVLDQKGYVHITDFGIAKKYQPNNARDTSGTIGYMAPEVLNNESHGYSVDFYAIGIITYEFLFGHRPYLAKSKRELKELILTRQAQVDVDELPNGWSPDAADFINQLIQRKPKNRLGLQSIDEVKTHPWFYNYDWERLEKRTTRAPLIPKKGDNFDRKYCSAPDKIGNDTMERYKQYMMDGSYEERFKHFSSDVIPDELKRTYNILGSQSLYNLSDISTNMNSHHTLNVNNSLQKTSRNKNDNNQNNSKHLSVGSINVGSSSKELVHVNKNESKPKENLPNNIMNDMFRKIDSRLRMSRQKEKRSPVNNPSHNGNNNVLKNSAIFLGSNKLKKSTSINKEEKSLSSSNSFKLIRNASQSKLVLEKKLPIINLSFTKKKNNSFKQDFSFSQLYPAPQFSDKRTSSRGKLRNKFFNLNHYYHNNSHIGSNNIINNSLNKSMYNGYNMNSGKQTNRSMSSLNYYGK